MKGLSLFSYKGILYYSYIRGYNIVYFKCIDGVWDTNITDFMHGTYSSPVTCVYKDKLWLAVRLKDDSIYTNFI